MFLLLYVEGSLRYFHTILVTLSSLSDLKRKLMLNRVAGLGLDDFLHEPKKGGGGGWWSDIVSFGKGKKQKNRTQILKRISQKINFVLPINTFTNNIFLTCMAKSFFSLNVWITFKLVLWGKYSLNHDNMIQCLPGSPYSSFETRESWLKSLTYITLYNQRFCLIFGHL